MKSTMTKAEVEKILCRIKMHTLWADEHPVWIDGVLENLDAARRLRALLEENHASQLCCPYGYVLPDRCRYSSRTGCKCGAYGPVKEAK